MALEDFNSDTDKEDEDSTWVSDGGIDWTCCSCDISEVHRFDEPPDELDLVAHMRAEHGLEFEEAKKRVMEQKELKGSNLPEHDKERMQKSDSTAEFMARTLVSSVGGDEDVLDEVKESGDDKESDFSEWDDAYN